MNTEYCLIGIYVCVLWAVQIECPHIWCLPPCHRHLGVGPVLARQGYLEERRSSISPSQCNPHARCCGGKTMYSDQTELWEQWVSVSGQCLFNGGAAFAETAEVGTNLTFCLFFGVSCLTDSWRLCPLLGIYAREERWGGTLKLKG